MELKPIFDGWSMANSRKPRQVSARRWRLRSGDMILNQALIPAMSEVGRLFEEQEYYLPEMLISAKAMQAGLALLKPHLQREGAASGRAWLWHVKGDLHDIGKNLVIIMLEGAGFQVSDLGVDVARKIRPGGQRGRAVDRDVRHGHHDNPYMKPASKRYRPPACATR